MPPTSDSRTDIVELNEQLKQHKEAYYNGEAVISDAEYDAIEHELQELVDTTPDLAGLADGLLAVGAPAASTLFDNVRHATPMLSLDKVHVKEDLEAFAAKFEGKQFALWPKFDGVSLSLTYEDGVLVRAATRGDGTIGEDITENVRGIAGVLSKIPENKTCEVRGEVVMLRSDFEAFNIGNPDNRLVNPRNAASGTLRAKSREKVADRKLTFYAFDLIDDSNPSGIADALRSFGFNIELSETAETFDEISSYIDKIAEGRDNFNFEIDGVVIKLYNRSDYEDAGNTSHHPRGAMAFKLAAEIGETVLEAITWQVGKSGVVAPVGEITPLFLSGTTISRASLHNLAIITERDIRVGDKIQIKRAGDVIPHVIGPISERRDGTEAKIEAPDECPSCGGGLIEVGESRVLRCENIAGCSAQKIRRLIHWASRAAADIDAIGESWIERLFDAGLLSDPSDFYTLTRDQLLDQGEGMGERLADKMLASIDASRNVGLRRTIIGMAIPLASEGTAKRVCRAGIGSIEELSQKTSEELCEIEDIGPMVAESLVAFLSGAEAEFKALRAGGANLDVLPEDAPVEVANTDGLFVGKRVCVTGSLSVGRKDFEALIEAAGGKATGSVSKNTDFVVAGENAGSKLAKAEGFGIPVLTEADARKEL